MKRKSVEEESFTLNHSFTFALSNNLLDTEEVVGVIFEEIAGVTFEPNL